MAPDKDDPTKQGETVATFDPPLEQTISDKVEFSTRIDYTDDYKDPRKGIRNIFYYDVQNASKDSEPSFKFKAFGESSIDLMVYFRANRYGDQNPIIHNFIKKLHKRFGEEDIEIPFPVRTLLHKNKL